MMLRSLFEIGMRVEWARLLVAFATIPCETNNGEWTCSEGVFRRGDHDVAIYQTHQM